MVLDAAIDVLDTVDRAAPVFGADVERQGAVLAQIVDEPALISSLVIVPLFSKI
jgi:hypothetical protein